MRTILIYGNCQSGNISRILNSVCEDVNIHTLTQVQRIDKLDYFEEIIPYIEEADYIITQNILDVEKTPFKRIIPYMKKDAQVIFFDSLYNIMYHPELITTNEIQGLLMGKVHDINIIQAFTNHISLKDFLKNDPFERSSFYSKDIYKKMFETSVNQLQNRQKKLFQKIDEQTAIKISHIDIVPFIKNIYESTQGVYHWGDQNHPRLPVFIYLVEELMKMMNLQCSDAIEKQFNIETFSGIHRPLYKSAIETFDIMDANRMYIFGQEKFSRKEYVEFAYESYANEDKTKLKLLLEQKG
ncbi:WcbI family polysaccharide biosynthesis putative acetyltransferase [Sulfurimonas sp.]|uniref:WcbI family polysaccharide biosynthesis putative acetyltransferase n=1 Tax=Sulfurimonas sp. TaxID=2022749 RepID=UPI003D0C6126